MNNIVDPLTLPDESPHYLQSVAELGENQDVVVQEDIFADNGMKLFAKGARINKSQCERLSHHKLRVPLDRLLSAENSVNAAALAADVNRMFANDLSMSRLSERCGDPQGFRYEMGTLELSRPLSFRMTVMREQRNDLYQHTLRVTCITHAMAVRLGMSKRDRGDLLLAGLCHDLGEMHTDPLLLVDGHRITPDERRFIHVHPITSYVILQNIPAIPSATLQAVLHHHERLDGSGYPYGLDETRIHPLAKVLCVAEVMEGVVRRADLQRLDVLLRLNQRRFDPAVVGVLRALLRTDTSEESAAPAESDASVKLLHVTKILTAWPQLHATLTAQSSTASEFLFLVERMAMLRSLVLQSGINPEDAEALLELSREDPKVLSEIQATLDELVWLMIDIANEIERRTITMSSIQQVTLGELIALLRST